MGSEIIKTTAKYQEANEPIKQKPIIQIDSRTLPNTIKAGLVDGGRDNPFRPDGEIYKSADPIVDYYKYGYNQSRAQSPTDSQLLLGAKTTSGQAQEGKQQSEKKQKRRKRAKEADDGQQKTRRPCLSRWLCCCCYRCCPSKDDKQVAAAAEDEASRQSNGAHLDEKEALSQYKAPPAVDTKTKEFKQTKIVVLRDTDDGDEEPELVGIQNRIPESTSLDNQTQPTEEGLRKGDPKLQSTQAKSSRCIIS